MGYFSNATEAEYYQEEYCYKCIHWKHEKSNEEYINNVDDYTSIWDGCLCWDIQWLYNYDECNKNDSILHKMIPRDENGFNKECIFFKQENKP